MVNGSVHTAFKQHQKGLHANVLSRLCEWGLDVLLFVSGSNSPMQTNDRIRAFGLGAKRPQNERYV